MIAVTAGSPGLLRTVSDWRTATVLLLITSLVLAGCETVPESSEAEIVDDPIAEFERRKSILAEMDRWSATGRLVVSTTKESMNASVRWDQAEENYTVRLSGPFGTGAAELKGTPEEVSLRADDKLHTAATPEELMENVFGWRLPVAGLRYWLMGLIAPGVEISDVRFDAGGRLEYLEQSGWRIQFKRYGKTTTLDMPTKVFMDSATLRARIVVQEWSFNPDAT